MKKFLAKLENGAISYCKFADENEPYIGSAIVMYTILFLALMIVL